MTFPNTVGEVRKPFPSAYIESIFEKLDEFLIYERSSIIVEAVYCDIFEIFCSWSCFEVDLQCPLAAAVVVAAAEKEFTTATPPNIKFGIEGIKGFG